MTIHLIDYLAYVLHCEISDLRNQAPIALDYQITKINEYEASLDEWIDLASYLTRKEVSFTSVEEAKEYILNVIDERA